MFKSFRLEPIDKLLVAAVIAVSLASALIPGAPREPRPDSGQKAQLEQKIPVPMNEQMVESNTVPEQVRASLP